MPYVINRPPAKRVGALAVRAAVIGMVVLGATGLLASTALADSSSPPPSTSSCSAGSLWQPFLNWNDSNFYTLVPGQSADNFDGTGWTLNGNASLVSTQLSDGNTGQVLDLPSGSSAVSPPMCVTSDYPTARTLVRTVSGWGGVVVLTSYANTQTDTWNNPQFAGWVGGGANWTLSGTVNLSPSTDPGWQLVQFTLIPTGYNSELQLYDLNVDPYAKG